MIAIVRGVRKWLALRVGLALAAALALLSNGCGNPGEGTVQVDPEVRQRLGKGRGPFADYKKNKVEPIGSKSRPRNAVVPK